MALSAHALLTVEGRLKSVRNEGDFTLEVLRIFLLYLPRFVVGELEYVTWHSLRIRYVLGKLG
jgi:hypothetical protein